MKIGKAILPIMENAFDVYSSAPLPFSIGVISALFVWSMSIEINAMYFSLAPLRIWYGLSVCVFGVVDAVLCVLGGKVVCGFGGIVAPLVQNMFIHSLWFNGNISALKLFLLKPAIALIS